MKSAKEWNWEHTNICANDPAVSGQMLPNPQMLRLIERIQADALLTASLICEANKENWGAAYNDIMAEIKILNENKS